MPRKPKKQFYISLDIEADGPYPIDYSMLQIGAVFYDEGGNEIARYAANLEEIPGAKQHPETMEFWALQEKKRPGTWAAMRLDCKAPVVAMQEFTDLVKKIMDEQDALPVVVAYPATYDFMWLYVYLCRFIGASIVGFAGYDMKSVASEVLGIPFRDATKGAFPRKWFPPVKRKTHVGIEDAEDQGFMFRQIRKAAGWHRIQAASGQAQNAYYGNIIDAITNPK